MTSLTNCLWPLARVDEVLRFMAQRQGLVSNAAQQPVVPDHILQDRAAFGKWLETTASMLGLEAEAIATNYAQMESLISSAAPAIFLLKVAEQQMLLAVLARRREELVVLGLEGKEYRITCASLQALICEPFETPLVPEIDHLLAEAGFSSPQKKKARAALLRERLRDRWFGDCWMLRLRMSQSLWQQARAEKIPTRFAQFVLSYAGYYGLWITSWALVGRGALQGRLEFEWLLAWVLLLATLILARLLSHWLESLLATSAGALIKQKLLYGALQLDPDRIRHQGAGQLFSRVAEAETVETLSLSGGFFALFAAIELVLTVFVLAAGPAPGTQLVLLLLWLACIIALAVRYLRRRERWTATRLAISHDLVERMVGHRTRIVQEARAHWHDEEDQALADYFEHSKSMDRLGTAPMALAARGWVVLGLCGLAPVFITETLSPEMLAVGIGGILLGYRALLKFTQGLTYLVGAYIAWQQLAAFLKAASQPDSNRTYAALLATNSNGSESHGLLVDARELTFRYRENGRPVLQDFDLKISTGERLLLQGPSGGGKSTLASLLTGLRPPNAGLLLLRGLDRQTLGTTGWRNRIVTAPQFHENHVVTATFAFNLLMGKRWPPRPEDLEEAETVCRELGLGELLQKMPAGLMQMVGETGWQLSHGERSRLYMARALLQNADLIILDESFAALDPENLQTAMQCAIARAKTLMVIAHP